ncbi:MAG TPA: MFS transporter [Dermatophilaceae bacterium]|nr:MFS transporter [Dermatophilaceae bacterium]
MASTDLTAAPAPYVGNERYRRPWYWYDWANSAYVTTTATVILGPYLTSVAKKAACPTLPSDATCRTNLHVLGIPIDPGSLFFYTSTAATIISAVLLVFVGAIADRSPRPSRLLGGFAWCGALAATLMFFVTGANWQLGVLLMVVASISLGASLVVYDSILCRIAGPDDRDAVSSRGWAFGYLGGGLLLALNLVLVVAHDTFRVSEGMAARISLASAGLWWGAFTLVPVIGMWNLRGVERLTVAREASIVGGSFRQLGSTFAEMREFPQTLRFLLAYLFFNDGIQTVIAASSTYGAEQLKFSQSQLIQTILLVQFVAFGGALLFGRIAGRVGAWRAVLWSLLLWTLIVVLAFFVPARAYLPFLALAVLIGIVLGGSQALTRSLYSQLIPRSREAEFFSFYQAMERGTSWFGMIAFGLVHQWTHSYRWAILALIAFFALGGWLLRRVDVRQGILDAGNEVPAVV